MNVMDLHQLILMQFLRLDVREGLVGFLEKEHKVKQFLFFLLYVATAYEIRGGDCGPKKGSRL